MISHDPITIGLEVYDFSRSGAGSPSEDCSPLQSVQYSPSRAQSLLAPLKRRAMSRSPSRLTPGTDRLDGGEHWLHLLPVLGFPKAKCRLLSIRVSMHSAAAPRRYPLDSS